MGDFEYKERKCPVCGKVFILPPENVYKLKVKDTLEHYCSYTCFRKIQVKQGRGKKKINRMR